MSKGKTKVCNVCQLEKQCSKSFSTSRYTDDKYCHICKKCNEQEQSSLNLEMRKVPISDFSRWQEAFKNVFEYKDGELFWTKKASDKVEIGKRAGYLMPVGRRRIRIYGTSWQEHRVIFLMHKGYLPLQIDHIDCNPLNNTIENLREATQLENSWNKRINKNINSSGYKNVSWKKDRAKWKVEVKTSGKPNFIGYFDDIELAALAAVEARDLYHGRFARHV